MAPIQFAIDKVDLGNIFEYGNYMETIVEISTY